MNVQEIVTRALNRSNLSVSDVLFRDLAAQFLDEIIHEHWESKHWQFRKRDFTISAVSGTEEYVLNKQVTVQSIVPDSMRGASPIRTICYRPTPEHNRVVFSTASGNPYWFKEGQYRGFQTNPSSASAIAFTSSLANYTTGTVTTVNGSRQVIFAGGASITLDMLGRWIRFGTDIKCFRLISRDFSSSTIFYLNEPYDGVSVSGGTFVIGDIQQKVSVLGVVSSQLQEEEVLLNGSTSVSTGKSFSSIYRISKSDKTYGFITATSNAAVVTNVVLDPGETEAEYQTILFYPNPSAAETISYEAYIKHPTLYKATDSPLFPQQFHHLLSIELYIRLMNEWVKKDVHDDILRRRDKMVDDMWSIDNNTDGWKILQETDNGRERYNLSNLPGDYDADY